MYCKHSRFFLKKDDLIKSFEVLQLDPYFRSHVYSYYTARSNNLDDLKESGFKNKLKTIFKADPIFQFRSTTVDLRMGELEFHLLSSLL